MKLGYKNVAVVKGGESALLKAKCNWYNAGEVIVWQNGKKIKFKIK